MNKKAIAVDVLKHPIIKKLLESKIATTSTINKIIIQEMMNEAPMKLSSKLKNIAIRVPSTVIAAASKLDTSPNGPQAGEEEKTTLEFSNNFEEMVKYYIDFTTNAETQADQKKYDIFYPILDSVIKGVKEKQILETPLIQILTKLYEVLSNPPKSDRTEVLTSMDEPLRKAYNEYLTSKASAEQVAQAMTDATKGEGEEQGQDGEAKPVQPVVTQISADDEAKKKLEQDPNAEAKIDQQVQADIKNQPDKEQEIKDTGEKLKDELADPEDEVPDDVRKQDLVKVFEEEGLEQSFEYFLDTFVSARYFDDQAKAINDVMKGLETFEAALKGGKVKQAALQENQEPKEIPPTILKQLTEKKKEMIEPLKKMAQLLKNFKQKQDLFSKERKDMVREEADKLQAVLRDVKVLLLATKFALPAEEPQPLQEQTKQEKIDNIKKVYAKVRPSMITISKLIRNFKDPEDDSKVSVSQVLRSMRAIKAELGTVSRYFSRKETSFTKDKITFGNLAGLIKRFANEIADIIDNLNEVIGAGDLSRQDTKGIVDKINELEDDIEKFIGAKKQPIPSEAQEQEQELKNVEVEPVFDDEDESVEPEEQESEPEEQESEPEEQESEPEESEPEESEPEESEPEDQELETYKKPLEVQKYNQIFTSEKFSKIAERINTKDGERITVDDIKAVSLLYAFLIQEKPKLQLESGYNLYINTAISKTKSFRNTNIEDISDATTTKLLTPPYKAFYNVVLNLIEKKGGDKFESIFSEVAKIYRDEVSKKGFKIPADFDFKKVQVSDKKTDDEPKVEDPEETGEEKKLSDISVDDTALDQEIESDKRVVPYSLDEKLTKKLEPIIETYFKRIQNG